MSKYETAAMKARKNNDIAVAMLLEEQTNPRDAMRKMLLAQAHILQKDKTEQERNDDYCLQLFSYLKAAFEDSYFLPFCIEGQLALIDEVRPAFNETTALLQNEWPIFVMGLWNETPNAEYSNSSPHRLIAPFEIEAKVSSSSLPIIHYIKKIQLPKLQRTMLTVVAKYWNEAKTWEQAEPAFSFLLSIIRRFFYFTELVELTKEVLKKGSDFSMSLPRIVKSYAKVSDSKLLFRDVEAVQKILAVAWVRNLKDYDIFETLQMSELMRSMDPNARVETVKIVETLAEQDAQFKALMTHLLAVINEQSKNFISLEWNRKSDDQGVVYYNRILYTFALRGKTSFKLHFDYLGVTNIEAYNNFVNAVMTEIQRWQQENNCPGFELLFTIQARKGHSPKRHEFRRLL